MTRHNELHGFLVLDKPGGITSRAALDRAGRWLPRGAKLGHAGTLDPLATGVLVACIGDGARLAEFIQAMPKVYRAIVHLGGVSDTDDADGMISFVPDTVDPGEEKVRTCLASFVGTHPQTPPAYSAAHVDGVRAYAKARRGEMVELTPRIVRIERIDLLAYDYPRLDIEVECGKGTYIRSLARDVGRMLGVGGYIAELRRLAIGDFRVETAVPWDSTREQARGEILPPSVAVPALPRVELDAETLRRFRQGQATLLPATASELSDGATVAVFDETSRLAGVGEVCSAGRSLRPTKVLNG